MLHLLMGNDPWFRAKSHGIGAGLPTCWQGWALIASYLGVLAGVGLSYSSGGVSSTVAYLLLFAVTAIFLSIVHKRTEGGWKWRWGA